MKRLLLFLLCQGSLDGYSQTADNNGIYLHEFGLACKCSQCIVAARPDTLCSHLLVSHRPPSFGHSIEGYCIVVNDVCTGRHLVYRRKKFVEIKPPYDVWRCIRKEVGRE
jgi:hypothetical protein